jgi:hypothetical protein
MNKDVLAATVRLNEPITLCRIEPLHRASSPSVRRDQKHYFAPVSEDIDLK